METLNKIFGILLATTGLLVSLAQIIRELMTTQSAMQITFFTLIAIGSLYIFSLIYKKKF